MHEGYKIWPVTKISIILQGNRDKWLHSSDHILPPVMQLLKGDFWTLWKIFIILYYYMQFLYISSSSVHALQEFISFLEIFLDFPFLVWQLITSHIISIPTCIPTSPGFLV